MKLTEVPSESEAAMICGYLEAAGIQATYNQGGGFGPPLPGPGGALAMAGSGSGQFAFSGSEVFVNSSDLTKARAALAEVQK